MTIETAINKQKAKLINKAKQSGLYENFGQKEVMNLENKFLTGIFHMDKKTNQSIQSFNDWCMNYTKH